MTPEQYAELLAVVGMASETNALVTALKVPVDEQYLK
jgi:alkylhydroperoxidase family enzyme